MVNPYKAPAVDRAEAATGLPGWGWRGYALFNALMHVGNWVVIYLQGADIQRGIAILVGSIGAIGVVGYAWHRRLLFIDVWKLWWILQAALQTLQLLQNMPEGEAAHSDLGTIFLLGTVSLMAPSWIALFRYRKLELWDAAA